MPFPLVAERTPSTERAFSYREIMRDLFGKVIRDTVEGFTRRSERVPEVDVESLLGMVMGASRGIGKISKEGLETAKKFAKHGLKYDAWTEPIPGMGYHQWTFYRGPLKGATVATKTAKVQEMEAKIAQKMREFFGEGK